MTTLLLSLCLSCASAPEAQVLRSLPEKNLIGISLGEAEAIQKGDTIEVWRLHKKIAITEVLEVGQHVSICKVMWWQPGLTIRKGDAIRKTGAASLKPGKTPVPKDPPETPSAPPDKPAPTPTVTTPAHPVTPATDPEDTRAPQPPLPSQPEALLAVGTLPGTIFVSTTSGVFLFRRNGMQRDSSMLPHKIYRFVPWGDKLWAETDGGVLLWEKGRWTPFAWSKQFGIRKPAFARITYNGTHVWGSFADQLLYWDAKANVLDVTGRQNRRQRGAWVRLGKPIGHDIEAILSGPNNNLVMATATGRILLRSDSRISLLGDLKTTGGDHGDPVVLDMAKDLTGAIWGLYFLGGGGLVRCTRQGIDRLPQDGPAQPGDLPRGTILRLAADPAGQLFALHQTEGIFQHDLGTWTSMGGDTPEPALDMVLEESGAILLLTENRLLRIGAAEEVVHTFFSGKTNTLTKS